MGRYDMVRIIVSDHTDAPLGDIDPNQVSELTEVSQVNGEHALTIVTTQELEKTNRLLVRDTMGVWHEYVVLGIESEHEESGKLWHEYYCVWSMQYDLSGTFVDNMYGCGVVPGHPSVPQPARRGIECSLEGTNRWQIGTVSVTAQAAASFYRRSGWEGLQTVVEKWGGELRATITVDGSGVQSRKVDLLQHEGRSTAVRRFDYGHDVTGIKQTVSDDIWPCRIVPLGASQETEEGGYTRRPSIADVNGGVMWLQDDDVVALTRVPDGEGGWEYPTTIVKNDTYEDPLDLLRWAEEHISDYTRPIVSYEATVAQFERAGMDAHGVALGDEVVIVDRTFGSEGLRLTARVLKIKQSLIDPSQTELTIGNLTPTLGTQFTALERQVDTLAEGVENSSSYRGGTEWVQNLLARINADINATGGYTYITEGQGIRTYDVAVTDPLVGAEASAVCEIKGGTMRIANSKDASGQWEWKTVFTSGHIMSELIEAIGSTSGYHAQLATDGLNIYNGATLLAHFGEQIVFYDDEGGVISSFAGNAIEFWGGLSRLYANGDNVYLTGKAVNVQGTDVSNVDGTTSTANVGTAIINNTLGAQMVVQSGDYNSFADIQLWPAVDMYYDVPTLHVAINSTDYDFALIDFVNSIPVTLYNNEDASASASATLSETAANFRRMTILYKDTDNTRGSVEVWSPNGKRVALALTWINGTATQSMYQRVRWVTISGTSIATSHNSGDAKYRTGQVQLGVAGSVDNSDYISITRVIGYR